MHSKTAAPTMASPRPFPPAALATMRGIDRFTDWVGHATVLLLVPLILCNVVEVFMRYVVGEPTIWAGDATAMANGSLFMLGAAYALLKGAHVRTDMLWDKFSIRTKGMIDVITYLILFLPVMAFVFTISIDDALYAYSINERSNLGLWRPITWPFRAVIPAAALLLFIQGVSELLKGLYEIKNRQEFTHHEKIEV